MSWFVFGAGVAGLGCVILGHAFFGIVWWMGVLAVVVTFLLSIVAARATGETDTTPIGAMGKITQLTYAMITPRQVEAQFLSTNLMTAAITAGAACHSSDLLQSLKTGYLVGANPRKQLIAQLFGIVVGVLVAVSVFSHHRANARDSEREDRRNAAAEAKAQRTATPTAAQMAASRER